MVYLSGKQNVSTITDSIKDVSKRKYNFYLLKNIRPLIIVHHTEEEFVAESRWIAPGISQDLILFISLPDKNSGAEQKHQYSSSNKAVNKTGNSRERGGQFLYEKQAKTVFYIFNWS